VIHGTLKQKATAPVLPRPSPRMTGDLLVNSSNQTWSSVTTPYTTPALTPSNGSSYFTSGDLVTHAGSYSSQSLSPTTSEWLLDYNHGNDLFTDYKAQSPHPAILESHNRLQFASPPTSEMGGEFEELARFHAHPAKRVSETDDCVRLATSTLTTLYNLPMTTPSGSCSNDRRPAMDETLDATALALHNLHTVLAYNCAKDFTLPMVILSIASKLLAWYQAVACVRDPYTERNDAAKEFVADGSLSNDRLGWVLKHQVVQGQLHGLSGMLATFRGAYCSGEMSEASLMFGSMEGHLRSRLTVTMQEIDARLRGCVE
jgi:hypothetical protein